ncbi:hypothetical protein Pla52o_21800 [Novipirellula galeiformis]|uniref:Sulfatase n=2 Tax=Novipirellula galeiformis TaxID=2528004 RepID=A0A5C6CLD4_9BACT|nr:hypothetical protein Pla52o_21800 [Novipirellula galeiformis]
MVKAMNNPLLPDPTRRHFFQDCGVGLGKMALASLIAGGASDAFAGPDVQSQSSAVRPTHFPAKAKRVIFLFMAGAPSQLDLFDNKPKLAELAGQPIPPSVIGNQRYAFIQPDAAVLGPQFPFAKYGESGVELSDRLPFLSKVVDDISLVKSCTTDLFNHAPAQLLFNTGNQLPGRPSMGAWLSYGLGSEANDLPSFVVLKSGGSLSGGAAMWSSGFLPSSHQGVPFRESGDPILNVTNPAGFDTQAQRDSLDLIRKMNQKRQSVVFDPEIETRIRSYEMAYRMQTRAPELMDFQSESAETLAMYGAEPGNASKSFANHCLLARRLAERGVRFIQVYHSGWDHHSNVAGGLTSQCAATDQGCAALIQDLKQRGLLDETLVVWGGEFGRTPMVESSAALGRSMGRDHHPQAFTMWFSGGGIKPGVTLGATDELGFNITERPVHVHDIQATILHCLGLDHQRLSVNFRGLNVKLTGVEAHHVVKELLA